MINTFDKFLTLIDIFQTESMKQYMKFISNGYEDFSPGSNKAKTRPTRPGRKFRIFACRNG
jgi:hypothetical protein